MKNKIDIDDFLVIINWVKLFLLIEGKPFVHQNLLDQAETYKFKNTPFDITIHNIDELMIDAYKIYNRIKITKNKVDMILEHITIISKDEILEEIKKYETIFENLIENYKYEDAEIRGIQKGILLEKMNDSVKVEDYETAARLRDIIKEC